MNNVYCACRDEIQAYSSSGLLKHLFVAYSRQQENKKHYVQV